MKTLILGYANYINTNASSVLAHERGVRTIYNQYGEGASEIAMLYGNESLLTESDVAHVFNGNDPNAGLVYPNAVYALRYYLEQNPSEYDLIVFSYNVDEYYIKALSYIPETLGIPLFMPMQNTSTLEASKPGEQSITFIGKGSTSNIGGYGDRLDCYDNQPTTSEATPMVAGKVSKLINAGLTQSQAIASLIKSCDLYPNWTQANGWGKVPDVIPDAVTYTVADKNIVPETTEPDPVTVPAEHVNTPEEVVEANEGLDNPVTFNLTRPSATRSGTAVTVTPNETSTTLTLYRKNRIEDDWVQVNSGVTAVSDTVDSSKNYIYSVKISNSTSESDFSEPVYVAGERKEKFIAGMI